MLLWVIFFFIEDKIEKKLKKGFPTLSGKHIYLDVIATAISCLFQFSLTFFIEGGKTEYGVSHANSDFTSTLLVISAIITIVVIAKRLDVNDVVAKFVSRAKSPNGEYNRISWSTFFLSGVLDNTAVEDVHISNCDLRHEDARIDIGVAASNAGGAASPGGDSTTIFLVLIKHLISPLAILWMYFPAIIGHLVTHLLGMNGVKKEIKTIVKNSDVTSTTKVRDIIVMLGCLISIPLAKVLVFTHIEAIHAIHMESVAAALSVAILAIGYYTITHRFPKLSRHEMEEIIKPAFLLAMMVWQVFHLGYSGLLGELGEILINQPIWIIALIAGLLSTLMDNMAVVALFVLVFAAIFPENHGFWSILAVSAGMSGSIHLPASAAGLVFKTMYNKTAAWKYFKRIGWKAGIGWLTATATAYAMYLAGVI